MHRSTDDRNPCLSWGRYPETLEMYGGKYVVMECACAVMLEGLRRR